MWCRLYHLGSRHRCKGVGWPQDGLVVHNRLGSHHLNASHLMAHLGGELNAITPATMETGDEREELIKECFELFLLIFEV